MNTSYAIDVVRAGRSSRALRKAEKSGADAVIFDLEDAVAAERRAEARGHITDYLRRSNRSVPLWVRINPVDATESGRSVALADLSAVVAARPDGIMLPKARHGEDVRRLDHWLEALEVVSGLPVGAVRVIPMITETAGALLAMPTFASLPPRVLGVTWGAEDLALDLGALGNRDASGRYEAPYVWASSLCLTAAAAAGVLGIDTVDTEIRDLDAMRTERVNRAARDMSASLRSILRRLQRSMMLLHRPKPRSMTPVRSLQPSMPHRVLGRCVSRASSSIDRIGSKRSASWQRQTDVDEIVDQRKLPRQQSRVATQTLCALQPRNGLA